MPRFRCRCVIPCYPEVFEIETKTDDESEVYREAVRKLEDCDIEPDCECKKIEKPLKDKIDPKCREKVEEACSVDCESYCKDDEFCYEQCYDDCLTNIITECLNAGVVADNHN